MLRTTGDPDQRISLETTTNYRAALTQYDGTVQLSAFCGMDLPIFRIDFKQQSTSTPEVESSTGSVALNRHSQPQSGSFTEAMN